MFSENFTQYSSRMYAARLGSIDAAAAEQIAAHSGEMRTARDERYIRTVFCQKSTERSACSARADDHIAKSHILSSLKLFVQ